MDDSRYDDDVRKKDRGKSIVLSDGRELTHRFIFSTLVKSGLREPYMKEAIYRLLTDKPLVVELSDRDVGQTVEIENYFKKKPHMPRECYSKANFEIDGISSDSPEFYNALERNGYCIMIK